MENQTLADLGWSAAFQSQLDLDDLDTYQPARVTSVHRDRIEALTPAGPVTLTLPKDVTTGDIAVGDWVLTAPQTHTISRILNRSTELARRGAGETATKQLIAANVDTLLIVTSCNKDFSPARLERYLVVAASAGCVPVAILTKADLTDPAPYLDAIRDISRDLAAHAIDARNPDDLTQIAGWAGRNGTLALVGSSGVGKTTLLNGLTGTSDATQDIREDDAKGRHTTTSRALRPMPTGGWIIDTPGMRELGLVDAADGLEEVFADITDLAQSCHFSDCAHDTEPDCAVRDAVEAGALSEDRLARWRKLQREDARASESLAEARARGKRLGRMYRNAQAGRRLKEGR